MGFSTEQINNLITGNALAAEITPSRSGLRKFIVVKGFELNERGQWKRLSKVLNTDKCETAIFQIRFYELPEEFITNNWDVTEDILTEARTIDQLQGIPALEKELKEYLDDCSVLVPEWKCENPL